MRTLLLSDIHANLTAFEAVLADAGSYDRVWCLGDVVGYGPRPNECISLLKSLPNLTCIMGNHDAAVMEFIDISAFNQEAQEALKVQAALLTQESRDFLEILEVHVLMDGVTLAHGTPRNPIWEYLMSAYTALENFPSFSTQVCLVGHTHIPSIFVEEPDDEVTMLVPHSGDMWRSTKRFMLNPGSVGQPRDRDPRAAYAVWDDGEDNWAFHRVAYDIAAVQAQIVELGIPKRHAHRLQHGL